jgi:hypothetical protein
MIEGILASGVLGTITGIFGNAINSFINYKTQRLKNEHDIKMAEIDIQVLKLESEAAVRVKKVETDAEIEKSVNEALKKSYDFLNKDLFDKSYMKILTEGKIGKGFAYVIAILFSVVDFLKHLVRPFITYYLLAASSVLTYLCYQLVQATGGALGIEQAYSLFSNSVLVILYLTTTCIGWWFADRRVAKFIGRLNDKNIKESDTANHFLNKFNIK